MKNVPQKIYLQLGDQEIEPNDNFNDLTQVSWCKDKINESDIEYFIRPITTVYCLVYKFQLLENIFFYTYEDAKKYIHNTSTAAGCEIVTVVLNNPK